MGIDISQKNIVKREAIAQGEILLLKETIAKIKQKTVEKGDVESSVKLAAIHAVKQTPNLLTYCHPIPIFGVSVNFQYLDHERIRISVHVKSEGKTGCEMEALAGVTNGLLMIWDMIKMYEKTDDGQYPSTKINNITVVKKIKS
jgi:cyclic pyranopterin phosphate synthase